MALLWKRITRASPLAVEEVEMRLAAATADWNGDFYGRGVPRPPWEGSRFMACQGMASFWFSLPLGAPGEGPSRCS